MDKQMSLYGMDMSCQKRSLLPVHNSYIFLSMAQQPLLGQGFLIIEASRSHSDAPHLVRLFWTSDQPDAETLS
jgi:hypothetical protein